MRLEIYPRVEIGSEREATTVLNSLLHHYQEFSEKFRTDEEVPFEDFVDMVLFRRRICWSSDDNTNDGIVFDYDSLAGALWLYRTQSEEICWYCVHFISENDAGVLSTPVCKLDQMGFGKNPTKWRKENCEGYENRCYGNRPRPLKQLIEIVETQSY